MASCCGWDCRRSEAWRGSVDQEKGAERGDAGGELASALSQLSKALFGQLPAAYFLPMVICLVVP